MLYCWFFFMFWGFFPLKLKRKFTFCSLFTLVLEYIMSITGDTTKDNISKLWIALVDCLGLHIQPV